VRASEGRGAGVAFHLLTGPVLATLAAHVTSPDVAAVVAGASTRRRADRLVGRHALALITAAQRPMIVVPVGVEARAELHHMLVPPRIPRS
jgi:hypothetical protein